MKISTQQFIDMWVDKWWKQEDLLEYCSSALKLIDNYGENALFTEAVRGVIQKYDVSLMMFLQILKTLEKTSPASVHNIIDHLDLERTSEWKILTSHPDKVKEIKPSATISSTDHTGLMIQWEWKIYKRSLDRDIDTLLK